MKGMYPALLTPFDAKEEIDYEALRKLVEKLISDGVEGLFLTGTSGEMLLLSIEERKNILKFVSEVNKGRIELIPQIAGLSLRDTIDMGNYAYSLGMDKVGVLPPLYYPYKSGEIIEYYKIISKEIKPKIILYDIPTNTNCCLTDDCYDELFNLESIVGIKCSHSRFINIDKHIRKFPNITYFIGCDECLTEALACGMTGQMGSTYNLIAKESKILIDVFNKGEIEKAIKLNIIRNNFIEVLCKNGCVASLKHLLTVEGIDCGNSRRPFAILKDSQKKELEVEYAKFKEQFYKAL